jgi:LuxR family transcriptional regulator, regulator of acetate metabolism
VGRRRPVGRTANDVADAQAPETAWRSARVLIGHALRRLGAVDTPAELREAAPRELCEACGFTRAMISAVHGTRWVPLVLHTQDDLDPEAAAFRAFVESDTEIPLATMLAETEMVRRRGAVLISDAPADRRTYKPIISVARSPGYIAAPLLVDGRTIGFLHADRVGQEQALDEADRRHIAAFAAELTVIYQRLSWAELLRARRRGHDAAVAAATLGLDRLDEPSPSLGAAIETIGSPRLGDVAAPRRDALLTPREREVLELVADGETNAAIAVRLSLSEDTVKTHMRGVLRKLHVTSRGAAVARYLRLRDTADG